MQRNQEVDILRGLAAILMILGHSFIVYPVNISTVPWCHWIGHFIYTFHMELFFVLAGAVYSCINYRQFILKKVKRILVPYIFFGILTLLFKAFGGSAINGVVSVGEGIIKFIFRGGNYWFLYVLFFTFAAYPWIQKVCDSWQKEVLLALFVLIIRQFSDITTIFLIGTLLYYLPFFVTGKIIFQNYLGYAELSKCTKVITILVGTLSYILLDYIQIKSVIELGVILSFVRAMAIISVLYILVTFVLKDNIKVNAIIYNFVIDCSKYSLQLYLFNGYLMTALRIIVCNVFHITTPIVIVGVIWVGNLEITLFVCKHILPRVPILKALCGLK